MKVILATTVALGLWSTSAKADFSPITDTISINGVFTSGFGSDPFPNPNFSLSITLPQQITLNEPFEFGYTTNISVSFTDGATYSYTNTDGNTRNIVDIMTAEDTGSTQQFNLVLNNGFFPDGSGLTASFNSPINFFSVSPDGQTATLTDGLYLISGSVAETGFLDPPFAGSATISSSSGAPAPMGAPAPLAGAGLLSFCGLGGISLRKRAKQLVGAMLSRRMPAA